MKILISYYITNFNLMKRHWEKNSKLKKKGIYGTNKPIGKKANLGGFLEILDWKNKEIIKTKKLSCPSGFIFKGNYLYVASMRKNKIYVLNKNFKIHRNIKNPLFNDIHDISKIKSNILVSNTGLDCILEINTKGDVVWDWWAIEEGYIENKLSEMREIDKGINHNLIDYPTLQQTTHLNSAISVDKSGNEILCSLFHQGQIIKINKKKNTHKVLLKGLKQPHALRKISQKVFLISDTNKSRIILFDKNGKILQKIKGDFDWIPCSTKLSNNNYLVADSNNNRIVEIDKKGNQVSSYEFDKNYKIYQIEEVKNG